MKFIAISLAALIVLTALCAMGTRTLTNITEETISLLEEVQRWEELGNRSRSMELLKTASDHWSDCSRLCGALMKHEELDCVEQEFARLLSYAKSQDDDDFRSNCAALITKLNQIQDMELPLAENIL